MLPTSKNTAGYKVGGCWFAPFCLIRLNFLDLFTGTAVYFDQPAPKSWPNYFFQSFSTKIQPKKDKFEVPPQEVNQLWGVDKNWKNLLIFRLFQRFQMWNHWKRFKINKKGWKWLKKVVWPAFGCWSKYTTWDNDGKIVMILSW